VLEYQALMVYFMQRQLFIPLILSVSLSLTSIPAQASDPIVELVTLKWDGKVAITETHRVPSSSVNVARGALAALPGVIAVDVDHGVRSTFGKEESPITMLNSAPSDPKVFEQWGLAKLDYSTISAEEVTSKNIVVAVLDSGVDGTHPELTGSVLPGWDAFDPKADGRVDPNGHGTHVAGIIAAARNGIGIEGLAQGVSILPVRVLDETGYGEESDVARGVLWAVANGAQVINMSLGGNLPNALLAASILEAQRQGIAVIVAAGNDGLSGSPISYPAADPGSYAVAATDAADRIAYFSTKNKYVAIAAPGVMITSTWPGNSYQIQSGTSMATPFVSASVAIVMRSTGLNPVSAADRLMATASDIMEPGKDSSSGAGLIDPLRALKYTTPRPVGERARVDAPPAATLPVLTPTIPSLPTLILPVLKPYPLPQLKPFIPPTVAEKPKTEPLLPVIPVSKSPSDKTAPYESGVRRNAKIEVTIKITKGVRTLTARLRSEAEPLPSRSLLLTTRNARQTLRTDALGRIKVVIPTGKVTLKFLGDRSYRPVNWDSQG